MSTPPIPIQQPAALTRASSCSPSLCSHVPDVVHCTTSPYSSLSQVANIMSRFVIGASQLRHSTSNFHLLGVSVSCREPPIFLQYTLCPFRRPVWKGSSELTAATSFYCRKDLGLRQAYQLLANTLSSGPKSTLVRSLRSTTLR